MLDDQFMPSGSARRFGPTTISAQPHRFAVPQYETTVGGDHRRRRRFEADLERIGDRTSHPAPIRHDDADPAVRASGQFTRFQQKLFGRDSGGHRLPRQTAVTAVVDRGVPSGSPPLPRHIQNLGISAVNRARHMDGTWVLKRCRKLRLPQHLAVPKDRQQPCVVSKRELRGRIEFRIQRCAVPVSKVHTRRVEHRTRLVLHSHHEWQGGSGRAGPPHCTGGTHLHVADLTMADRECHDDGVWGLQLPRHGPDLGGGRRPEVVQELAVGVRRDPRRIAIAHEVVVGRGIQHCRRHDVVPELTNARLEIRAIQRVVHIYVIRTPAWSVAGEAAVVR